MPVVNGSLKTKELTLQGSSAAPDFKLKVENDELAIKRGDNVLMTISQDDEAVLGGEVGGTDKVTITAPVTFENSVEFKGSVSIPVLEKIAKMNIKEPVNIEAAQVFAKTRENWENALNPATQFIEIISIDLNEMDASKQDLSKYNLDANGKLPTYKVNIKYGDNLTGGYTLQSIKDSVIETVKFYFERGYTLPYYEADPNLFSNQFTFSQAQAGSGGGSTGYWSFNFKHSKNNDDDYLLMAITFETSGDGLAEISHEHEYDESAKEDFRTYPIRLHLTKDAIIFSLSTNIAYIDESNILRIKIDKHLFVDSNKDVVLGDVEFKLSQYFEIENFYGSFACKTAGLESADLENANVLVQVDTLKFDYRQSASDVFSKFRAGPQSSDGKFMGLTASKKGDGMNIVRGVNYNVGFMYQWAGTKEDNAFTKEEETFGSGGSIFLLDDGTWKEHLIYYVSPDKLKNPGYPETMATDWPEGTITVANDFHFTHNVLIHEFAHNIQSMGDVYIYETMAEGVSYSIDGGKGSILGWSSAARHNFFCRLYRGASSVLEPSKDAGIDPSELANSDFEKTEWTTYEQYGGGLFYVYMQEQFDHDIQFLGKFVSTSYSTVKSLLADNKVDSDIENILFDKFGYNLFKGDKGLHSLADMTIKKIDATRSLAQIFENFCIASVILRNNTSIPEQYRFNYPLWIASANNPAAQVLNDNSTSQAYGIPPKPIIVDALVVPAINSQWWDFVNENKEIPTENSLHITVNIASMKGETTIPLWPKQGSYKFNATGAYDTSLTFNLYNLTMRAYEVPAGSAFRINVNSGESVSCCILRYTSDGTSVGKWEFTGMQVASVGSPAQVSSASFTGAGKTKLIVLNKTVKDTIEINDIFNKPGSRVPACNVTINLLS